VELVARAIHRAASAAQGSDLGCGRAEADAGADEGRAAADPDDAVALGLSVTVNDNETAVRSDETGFTTGCRAAETERSRRTAQPTASGADVERISKAGSAVRDDASLNRGAKRRVERTGAVEGSAASRDSDPDIERPPYGDDRRGTHGVGG
jgi:hypothetical protein